MVSRGVCVCVCERNGWGESSVFMYSKSWECLHIVKRGLDIVVKIHFVHGQIPN